jgi:hypothetical protein
MSEERERVTLSANQERDRYREALLRIEREDHHHGPGWFAEIASEALGFPGQGDATRNWAEWPDQHRPLSDLADALVFLQEIEFAMRHAPIKQHDRTPEEQRAVERYTTYYVWINDVLRQHGIHRLEDETG